MQRSLAVRRGAGGVRGARVEKCSCQKRLIDGLVCGESKTSVWWRPEAKWEKERSRAVGKGGKASGKRRTEDKGKTRCREEDETGDCVAWESVKGRVRRLRKERVTSGAGLCTEGAQRVSWGG